MATTNRWQMKDNSVSTGENFYVNLLRDYYFYFILLFVTVIAAFIFYIYRCMKNNKNEVDDDQEESAPQPDVLQPSINNLEDDNQPKRRGLINYFNKYVHQYFRVGNMITKNSTSPTIQNNNNIYQQTSVDEDGREIDNFPCR